MAVTIYPPDEAAALTAAFRAGAQFLFGGLPFDRETDAKVTAKAASLYPTTQPAREVADSKGRYYRAILPHDPQAPRFEVLIGGEWQPLDAADVQLTLEIFGILLDLNASPLAV